MYKNQVKKEVWDYELICNININPFVAVIPLSVSPLKYEETGPKGSDGGGINKQKNS